MASANQQHIKNPERVAAGLKASIHNPKVSDEAKAHASERLQELSSETSKSHHPTTEHTGQDVESNRVLGGYKATLHNEKTSEEAKKHAREILSASGYHEFEKDETAHNTRVIAGYKAALHNPKVSDDAKKHARDFLKDHDAL